MWETEGDFRVQQQEWGGYIRHIKYRYKHKPSETQSNVSNVQLSGHSDFFKISVQGTWGFNHKNLAESLNKAGLRFDTANFEFSFKFVEISEFMKFMDVVATIEPKVSELKSQIAEQCKAGFANIFTAASTADLQPEMPEKRRSSLSKP